jgi:hypothetical protein
MEGEELKGWTGVTLVLRMGSGDVVVVVALVIAPVILVVVVVVVGVGDRGTGKVVASVVYGLWTTALTLRRLCLIEQRVGR